LQGVCRGDRWFHACWIWEVTRAGGHSQGIFQPCLSAHQHYHHYAAGQQVRGGREPVRGIAGREQEQMRCIWHVCALTAVRRDGKASQPGAGRPGFLNDRQTDAASRFTLCPFPLHLPLPPAALCHRWTGAAERLLALHLHQRARLKAHHNLDVLPRAIHPCSAAPLAASLASSSAVISIGQGCNKFEGQPSARRAHCTQGRLC
jgi:hypothetical protein